MSGQPHLKFWNPPRSPASQVLCLWLCPKVVRPEHFKGVPPTLQKVPTTIPEGFVTCFRISRCLGIVFESLDSGSEVFWATTSQWSTFINDASYMKPMLFGREVSHDSQPDDAFFEKRKPGPLDLFCYFITQVFKDTHCTSVCQPLDIHVSTTQHDIIESE